MSKNIQSLSGRKGLKANLFERLVTEGRPEVDAHRTLARDYLLGEAMTFGAASFYDLMSEKNAGRKVLVCDGSACLCAGTQEAVKAQLQRHFSLFPSP